MAVMVAFTISATGESIVSEIGTTGGSAGSGSSGKSGVVSSAGMNAMSVSEAVAGSAIGGARRVEKGRCIREGQASCPVWGLSQPA